MSIGLSDTLEGYSRERKNLIPVLQKVQEKLGYLSEEAIAEIARFLRLSENDIYGVASFYAQFRFQRPGEHMLKICMGTACHVRGAPRMLDEVRGQLGIEPGQTTADKMFTLERVNCLGACALGPIVVMDGKYHRNMTPNKLRKLVQSVRETEKEVATDAA